MKKIDLTNVKHVRIIPSVFPTVNFFENLVDAHEMETLWEIEALTNDRLREQIGDLFLIAPEDRLGGPGSSVVMAAFTHIGKSSRFTDGSFGVYYASLEEETAIRETIYHREKFLAATHEEPGDISMRMYQGEIQQILIDIRGNEYQHLHHPDDYRVSQQFGLDVKQKKAWGLLYNSVRNSKGQCIALFRPAATSIPVQIKHLKYTWNGKKITNVYELVWRG